MVATSGDRLLRDESDAVVALRELLIRARPC
jgi:hypothetical protein